MLVNAQLRRVAILGGNRIPFARSNTAYATASNQQMLTAALQGLIDRFNLHGQRLDEVVAGAVIKHARDFNLTRETVLSTTLAKQTPAYDIQQACGTGLEAAILVANKIALGQIDVGIAGGTDTTSDAPVGLNEKMRKILLEANRAKSTGARVKALARVVLRVLGEPGEGIGCAGRPVAGCITCSTGIRCTRRRVRSANGAASTARGKGLSGYSASSTVFSFTRSRCTHSASASNCASSMFGC